MTTEDGGRRRNGGPDPRPENVVAYFNRGRQVANDLLRENELLRSRITRLEGELRRRSATSRSRADGGES